jgi:hypothetical protein
MGAVITAACALCATLQSVTADAANQQAAQEIVALAVALGELSIHGEALLGRLPGDFIDQGCHRDLDPLFAATWRMAWKAQMTTSLATQLSNSAVVSLMSVEKRLCLCKPVGARYVRRCW